MAQVYSVCFAHRRLTDQEVSLYVVPVGFVAVVRDICMYTDVGNAQGQLLGVTVLPDSGSIVYAYLHLQAPVAAGVMYHWQGRQVLTAGNDMRAITLADNGVYRVSGYLLTV